MQQYYNIPDIKNRDIRRLARRSLREKWGMAILPMLIITLALTLPSLVQYWDLMSSGLLDGSTQDITAMMEEMNNSKAGPLSSVLSFFSFLCLMIICNFLVLFHIFQPVNIFIINTSVF